jgi:aminoglycoside N3'-acetyltransferase
MGPDSPLGRLQRQGGLILHLGTDHQTTSAKHLAECLEDAPCLRSPPDPFPIRLRKGPTVVEERVGFAWRYREKPCPINDGPDALSRAMHGRERVGNVGDARASLCELREFIRAARDQLRAGTVEWPGCSSCSIGPSARREGDWD